MSEYSEYFLNSKSSVAQLECLEISHNSFTQVFYIVRNAANGLHVKHEDNSEHDYIYVPMRLSLTGARTDLDHILKVELGDLGQIIPQQIDAVAADDGFLEMPKVVYRVYRSDDLENVLYGPLNLELKTFNLSREGCAFEAKAPSLNVNRTGERYTLPRFPMMRGLL